MFIKKKTLQIETLDALYEWEQKKIKKQFIAKWAASKAASTKVFMPYYMDFEKQRKDKRRLEKQRKKAIITAITIDVLGQLFVNI